MAIYRTGASVYAIQAFYGGGTGSASNTVGMVDYGATVVPGPVGAGKRLTLVYEYFPGDYVAPDVVPASEGVNPPGAFFSFFL